METAIGFSKLDLICTVSETPLSDLLRILSKCNKRFSSSIKCLGTLLSHLRDYDTLRSGKLLELIRAHCTL